jgi:hypothetical protein
VIGSLLMNLVRGFGGFFFIFFIVAIGTGAGALIAEVVRWVVGKRRSQPLFIATTAGVVLGGLAANAGLLLSILFGNLGALLGLLWPGIFIFLAASTTYMRLSGIQIGR